MDRDDLARLDQEFVANGYIVIELGARKALDAMRDALLEELRGATGRPDADFASYHESASDAALHTQVQARLSERLRDAGHCRRVLEGELDFFRAFLGPDLCIQRFPYVRIARPGVEEDNVDFHRDTQYGRSPYELSIWIPLLDISPDMALRLLPGSHTAPESDFPTRQLVRHDVPKGSLKHRLGFPYAPKKLAPDLEGRTIPVPVRYGQLLVFSLSIVHGQRVNRASATRFSVDVRLVNSLAPIRWTASVSGDYYETLSRSSVTEQALVYHARNAAGADHA